MSLADSIVLAEGQEEPSVLHDLEIARAAVSNKFGPFGRHHVFSQPLVNGFAELTGDFNPLHLDAQVAAKGPFGKRVVHGLFVIALITGKIRPAPPFVLSVQPVLRGFREISFVRAIAPRDRIACRERVSAVAHEPRQGIVVTSDFEVHLMDREPTKAAICGTIDVLYPYR